MINITVTPAVLSWTGGMIETIPALAGLTPARMSWSGGIIQAGPGTQITATVDLAVFARLQRQTSYFNPQGNPSIQMQTHWQRHCEKLEQILNGQQAQITDLSAIVARIANAEAKADAAVVAAETTSQQVSLVNSYPSPTGLLTASSDGMVTIDAHERVYDYGTNKTTVPVDGGSVSGFAQGDYVTVYYSDAARQGGAVVYQGTDQAKAQGGAVHVIGAVKIPEVGEPPAPGQTVPAPGYTPPRDLAPVGYNYQ